MRPTILIKFLPGEQNVDASHGETILAAGLRGKVQIPHSCGGNGTCGTCRVWVIEGLDQLPQRNEVEQEMADDRMFSENERLCCQNYAVSGLVLKIPQENIED